MKDKFYRMDYSLEPKRSILCIDVKSFFASVEAVERGIHPLDSWIAVVSKPNNQGGLILASSPNVKEHYGIKTGSRVWELPRKSKIQIVEPRMKLYVDKNLDIIRIFNKFAPFEDILVYSIDEAFLDVTHSRKLHGSSYEIAKKIQDTVFQQLGLVVTIGIGPNPLMAKLALDHQAKKDRKNRFLAEWTYEDVPNTVWRIKELEDFWGIGSKTAKKLRLMGIRTILDLSQVHPYRLKPVLGIIGEQHFYHSHGIDRSRLKDTYIPKSTSYSKNQILNRDYKDPHEIEIVIREMTEENAVRLREHQVTTSTVKLTIGYSYHVEEKGFSKQLRIEATDQTQLLQKYMLKLFQNNWEEYPVRIVNVTFSKIQPKSALQLNLFETVQDISKREKLDQTLDTIRSKFGYTSILHASSLMTGGMAKYRDQLLGGHKSGE